MGKRKVIGSSTHGKIRKLRKRRKENKFNRRKQNDKKTKYSSKEDESKGNKSI
jgi:hypothetical protein